MLQTCWNHDNLAQQQQHKWAKHREQKTKTIPEKKTRKENQFSSQQ